MGFIFTMAVCNGLNEERAVDAATELRERIERMRDALKDARKYIQHFAAGGIGHIGDEIPVIDKINNALES
jgi:predicted urease superfamily metal-dependent hydrolase